MSREVSIRRATVEDMLDVLEIARSCMEVPHWSEGVWAQTLVQHSTYAPYGAPPYGPQRRCLVAEYGEQFVGFIVVSVVGVSGTGNDVAEIESLAVREAARGHGVGRSLCLQAIFWANTLGADSMQLEVRSASAAALALYRSLGFVEEGRRVGYYAEPKDDAVLMSLRLGADAK